MSFKIPFLQTTDKDIYNYIAPVNFNISVTIPIKYLGDKNAIKKKCKLYEGMVVPWNNGCYIIEIVKFISISDGFIDVLQPNGDVKYTVNINAYIINDITNDIIVGCTVVSISKNPITLIYKDRSIYLTLIDMPNKIKKLLRIGSIINIMIKEMNMYVDKYKYIVKHKNNEKITYEYTNNIYTDVNIYNKKTKLEDCNTISYSTHNKTNNIYDIKGSDIDINTLQQINIVGNVFVIWNIPFNLRYVWWRNTRQSVQSAVIINDIKYIKGKVERIYGNPKRYIKFKEIQNKLHNAKNNIWEKYYKYMLNPYELIWPAGITSKPRVRTYYSQFIKGTKYTKNNIQKILLNKYNDGTPPVSRAYYKLYEILHVFGDILDKDPKLFVTLGDAPGGFAQALAVLYPGLKIISVSLLIISDDGHNIAYHPRIKSDYKTIEIEPLKEGDGNLLKIVNIKYMIDKYRKTTSICGCDAALEYGSKDAPIRISKETQHFKILMSQLVISVGILKLGGMCTIKLYGRFTEPTVQLFYLISQYFKNFYIYKPKSSRITNSEVFVVYTGFIGIKNTELKNLIDSIDNILESDDNVLQLYNPNNIPKLFKDKIIKYNINYSRVRAFYHLYGLELIKTNVNTIKKLCIQEQINYSLEEFTTDTIDGHDDVE